MASNNGHHGSPNGSAAASRRSYTPPEHVTLTPREGRVAHLLYLGAESDDRGIQLFSTELNQPGEDRAISPFDPTAPIFLDFIRKTAQWLTDEELDHLEQKAAQKPVTILVSLAPEHLNYALGRVEKPAGLPDHPWNFNDSIIGLKEPEPPIIHGGTAAARAAGTKGTQVEHFSTDLYQESLIQTPSAHYFNQVAERYNDDPKSVSSKERVALYRIMLMQGVEPPVGAELDRDGIIRAPRVVSPLDEDERAHLTSEALPALKNAIESGTLPPEDAGEINVAIYELERQGELALSPNDPLFDVLHRHDIDAGVTIERCPIPCPSLSEIGLGSASDTFVDANMLTSRRAHVSTLNKVEERNFIDLLRMDGIIHQLDSALDPSAKEHDASLERWADQIIAMRDTMADMSPEQQQAYLYGTAGRRGKLPGALQFMAKDDLTFEDFDRAANALIDARMARASAVQAAMIDETIHENTPALHSAEYAEKAEHNAQQMETTALGLLQPVLRGMRDAIANDRRNTRRDHTMESSEFEQLLMLTLYETSQNLVTNISAYQEALTAARDSGRYDNEILQRPPFQIGPVTPDNVDEVIERTEQFIAKCEVLVGHFESNRRNPLLLASNPHMRKGLPGSSLLEDFKLPQFMRGGAETDVVTPMERIVRGMSSYEMAGKTLLIDGFARYIEDSHIEDILATGPAELVDHFSSHPVAGPFWRGAFYSINTLLDIITPDNNEVAARRGTLTQLALPLDHEGKPITDALPSGQPPYIVDPLTKARRYEEADMSNLRTGDEGIPQLNIFSIGGYADAADFAFAAPWQRLPEIGYDSPDTLNLYFNQVQALTTANLTEIRRRDRHGDKVAGPSAEALAAHVLEYLSVDQHMRDKDDSNAPTSLGDQQYVFDGTLAERLAGINWIGFSQGDNTSVEALKIISQHIDAGLLQQRNGDIIAFPQGVEIPGQQDAYPMAAEWTSGQRLVNLSSVFSQLSTADCPPFIDRVSIDLVGDIISSFVGNNEARAAFDPAMRRHMDQLMHGYGTGQFQVDGVDVPEPVTLKLEDIFDGVAREQANERIDEMVHDRIAKGDTREFDAIKAELFEPLFEECKAQELARFRKLYHMENETLSFFVANPDTEYFDARTGRHRSEGHDVIASGELIDPRSPISDQHHIHVRIHVDPDGTEMVTFALEKPKDVVASKITQNKELAAGVELDPDISIDQSGPVRAEPAPDVAPARDDTTLTPEHVPQDIPVEPELEPALTSASPATDTPRRTANITVLAPMRILNTIAESVMDLVDTAIATLRPGADATPEQALAAQEALTTAPAVGGA